MGLLGKVKRGLAFVVSAPAGAGKTTLVEMLLSEFPKDVCKSLSSTTRKPRDYEIPGKDYEFLSKEEFESKKSKGEFLEYAKVFSNYYGTLKSSVESELEKGKHVFLVIDTQGAQAVKSKLDVVSIFVIPPSINELENRLKHRESESMQDIKERLSWAQNEIEKAKEFDFILTNDDLQLAYEELKNYIKKTERKFCNYL